jgi:CubicO group peptidase (beta-lactamase class C family)
MYALLGVLIEDVSQQPFHDYVKKHIMDKHNLGEVYTRLADVPEKEKGRIPAGSFNGKKVTVAENLETIGAAGGFHATPSAVSQFFHKLANYEILPRELVDEMFSPLNPHVLPGRNYGLGAVCCPSETGNLWGHTGAGSGDGRRSATLHCRELNLTVSVAQIRIERDGDHPNKVEQEFGCVEIIKKLLATIQAAEPCPSNRQSPEDIPSPVRSERHPVASSTRQVRTHRR